MLHRGVVEEGVEEEISMGVEEPQNAGSIERRGAEI